MFKPKQIVRKNTFHSIATYPNPAGITTLALLTSPPAQLVCFNIPFYSSLSVQDWIPAEAPKPGDNFCGVDRSIDVAKLAGSRLTQGDYDPKEAVYQLDGLIRREGGFADSLYAPVGWLNGKGNPTLAQLHTAHGTINCYETPYLGKSAFLIQSSAWSRDQYYTMICEDPMTNGVINIGPPKPKIIPVCECGKEKHGFATHSTWCPVA